MGYSRLPAREYLKLLTSKVFPEEYNETLLQFGGRFKVFAVQEKSFELDKYNTNIEKEEKKTLS